MDFENENDPLKMNEDEDDEGFLITGGKNTTKFTLSIDYHHGLEQFKAIIFTTSGNVSAFGTQYLSTDSKVPIGTIQKESPTDSSDIELWGLRVKKPEPSYLYAITPDVLLCCCNSTLSPEDYHSFSSTVLDILPNNIDVIILTISSISDFKCDLHINELDAPIIRVLTTMSLQDDIMYVKLEQPNILSGISAGILTACDIRGMKAAACIIYSSSMELDITVVGNFSKFLSVLQATKHLKMNSFGQLPVIDNRIKTGNLYI